VSEPKNTIIPQSDQAPELREHLKLLRLMRERRLYAGAKEVIFELEKINSFPELIWLELEAEKAALFMELGDWWRAVLSLTHIIQHPESTSSGIQSARASRMNAAFEAGDFQLAQKDFSLISGNRSFSLEMSGIRLKARTIGVEAAELDLKDQEPESAEDYLEYIRTQIDLRRLGGRETTSLCKAAVILCESGSDINQKALAWMDYLISLQWEPLRIRNDAKLAQMLPFSARTSRLMDEISSPGLDLFRSTSAQTLIHVLRFDREAKALEDLTLAKYVVFERSKSVFDRERSRWMNLAPEMLSKGNDTSQHLLRI
jgi:hypothetical protein